MARGNIISRTLHENGKLAGKVQILHEDERYILRVQLSFENIFDFLGNPLFQRNSRDLPSWRRSNVQHQHQIWIDNDQNIIKLLECLYHVYDTLQCNGFNLRIWGVPFSYSKKVIPVSKEIIISILWGSIYFLRGVHLSW